MSVSSGLHVCSKLEGPENVPKFDWLLPASDALSLVRLANSATRSTRANSARRVADEMHFLRWELAPLCLSERRRAREQAR
jgi:hypothetical protein